MPSSKTSAKLERHGRWRGHISELTTPINTKEHHQLSTCTEDATSTGCETFVIWTQSPAIGTLRRLTLSHGIGLCGYRKHLLQEVGINQLWATEERQEKTSSESRMSMSSANRSIVSLHRLANVRWTRVTSSFINISILKQAFDANPKN